ncbi:DUF302 domain-containing protein [Methylacidiphilum caldifontis]|uniref:DUF302 domain-containing protein n=1 Tax=Methylacidiphilum caldifontis TaxID=2795386 RepID=A0A4Y8PHB9_9BACT|nr:DUF302 domain-containing protein [Methylacidiphilum caldifontis]TFE71088.1 hypothetical protein A7Q10_05545 [Methylacidiphilum caldifontis]
MLIIFESKKEIEELRKSLEINAAEKNFGVMGVHDISKTLENKGFRLDYRCLILEICSPRFAKQVLEQNPEVSTALPCRIAVYEHQSHRVVATLSPRAIVELFKAPGLYKVAEEVENILKEIMQKSI